MKPKVRGFYLFRNTRVMVVAAKGGVVTYVPRLHQTKLQNVDLQTFVSEAEEIEHLHSGAP